MYECSALRSLALTLWALAEFVNKFSSKPCSSAACTSSFGTCATHLLSHGTHPKYVQHLLGHASIQLTLDRYSHWIPSMGRATAEGMDEALG
jgi:hypothetical protein